MKGRLTDRVSFLNANGGAEKEKEKACLLFVICNQEFVTCA
jgi:hypothetical protein